MSSTPNVGNNVGAVNDFQLNNTAPYRAHGKQTGMLEQPSTGVLKHSCEGQKSDGMHSAQNSPRIPEGHSSKAVTSLGNSLESGIPPSNTPIPREFCKDAIQSLRQNNRIMEELIQIDAPSFVLHPEAVKTTNEMIINVLTSIEETDFSADAIETAIKNSIEKAGAKNYAKENDPSTAEAKAHENGDPVLEKYDKHFHGGAYGEKADQDFSTKYKRKPNKKVYLPGALRGNKRTKIKEGDPKLKDIGLPKTKPEDYQQNGWSVEINQKIEILKNQTKGSEDYKRLEGEINELKKMYLKSKIVTSENVDKVVELYSNQLIREYDQFSDDIEIKKLKPGTVLVRDFGKKQLVKGSCWCLASDLNSAVNCDKDLQTQLAVFPSWNGGGNRAVFVVPQEPPPIYVAVGKIAQQRNDNDYERTVYHPGGGTQYNILTPNDCNAKKVKDVSGGFADAGKAFDKCCFVITNTGIIEANDRKTVQADQLQASVPSSNDDQSN